MVTVWKKEAEKAEVQELGYLSVLQQREPTHTFRHDLNTFKAQGTTNTFVFIGAFFLIIIFPPLLPWADTLNKHQSESTDFLTPRVFS